MNLAKLIPPWVFVICVVANTLFAGSSALLGLYDLFILNVLSGLSCYIGYRLSIVTEKED